MEESLVGKDPGLRLASTLFSSQPIKYFISLEGTLFSAREHLSNQARQKNSLYQEFGVLKLRDLHDFNICCIVHKFIHFPHLLPEGINNIFFRNDQIHHYDTRHKKDLHPIKTKTTLYGEQTVSFQGRNCRNKLPSDIKEIKSINLFKKKLKQHMINNY